MWESVTPTVQLTYVSRGDRKLMRNTYRSPVGSNNVLHQLLIHVHLLRKIESLALQQFTLVLPRSLESFRHLEGVFSLSLTIFERVILLRWWEMSWGKTRARVKGTRNYSRRRRPLAADFVSHSPRRMNGATAIELNSFSVRPKAPAIKCVHSRGFSVNLAPSFIKA